MGRLHWIQTVVRAVKGTRTIIDLAAIVGDPACEEDRQTALETNYAATRMLIEVANRHPPSVRVGVSEEVSR
jgi:nucleoside-diphosphate-sugar epimerase